MVPVSVALDLDRFVILEIPEKLPQILTAIIGQNKNHFLNVFQIIHKTAEHLTISINQRLDVLQIVCVDVIVKERKEWYLSDSVLIAIRIFAQLRIDQKHLIWNQLIQFVSRFQPVCRAFFIVPVLVNSGSSANLIAFMTLTSPLLGERRVKRGDEIITVAAGFPTTVTPAIQYGAVPVFVDVTIPQYNIDVTKLEAALSDKTKAVMIAHTLGNPFDLKAVKEFCEKHNLWLVEDNCVALGSRYNVNGE